jgi:hypothetical protein
MPDDLTALVVDEGPGAFMPRPEHASPEAVVRLHARATSDSAPSSEVAQPAHPDRKAKRKAARAARRKNRA